MLGGHVRAVFTLVTIIFIVCVTATITSFREIPMWRLEAVQSGSHMSTTTAAPIKAGDYIDMDPKTNDGDGENTHNATTSMITTPAVGQQPATSYGSVASTSLSDGIAPATTATLMLPEPPATRNDESATLTHYLLSILHMPHSMRMICLTNLFCWMAHVCYSLYFTDFVGEAVFGGDPAAMPGTRLQMLYEEGVRFGCWGMAMYSLSCACYSLVIERLIAKFR